MKIRTLLVDDSPETLDTLYLLFASHPDVEVVDAVHTVSEAVEVLNTTGIDLVSIDIQLKFGSGFQLCAYVHDRYPDVFITMCSAEAHERNQTLASQAGAHHFLAKPLNLHDIGDLMVRYKTFRDQRLKQDKGVHDNENWVDHWYVPVYHVTNSNRYDRDEDE
jgi:DNA-binding response OmpR family regulator